MIHRLWPAVVALALLSGVSTVEAQQDAKKPELTGVTYAPALFATDRGDFSIAVTVTAEDDLSGFGCLGEEDCLLAEGYFTSPSGLYQRVIGFYWSDRTGDKSESKKLSATKIIMVPQFSEPGDWRFTSIRVVDRVGNSTVLTTDAIAEKEPTTKGQLRVRLGVGGRLHLPAVAVGR